MKRNVIFDVAVSLFLVASICFVYIDGRDLVVLYVGGGVLGLWVVLKCYSYSRGCGR